MVGNDTKIFRCSRILQSIDKNYKHCFQMLSILKKKAINLRALHKHSAITIVTTPIALVDILDASLVYAAHDYDTDYYRTPLRETYNLK